MQNARSPSGAKNLIVRLVKRDAFRHLMDLCFLKLFPCVNNPNFLQAISNQVQLILHGGLGVMKILSYICNTHLLPN
jgi:hypothetical protein